MTQNTKLLKLKIGKMLSVMSVYMHRSQEHDNQLNDELKGKELKREVLNGEDLWGKIMTNL